MRNVLINQDNYLYIVPINNGYKNPAEHTDTPKHQPVKKEAADVFQSLLDAQIKALV